MDEYLALRFCRGLQLGVQDRAEPVIWQLVTWCLMIHSTFGSLYMVDSC